MRTGRKHIFAASLALFVAAAIVAACQTTNLRTAPLYARADGARGPQLAEGAVVYLHGKHATEESFDSSTPPYLNTFRSAGWDVYRLDRPRAIDKIDGNAHAILRRLRELREEGYEMIALAGQSFGAWSILKAATWSKEMVAVIAAAPAAHGTAVTHPAAFRRKPADFKQLMEGIKTTRVMIFFFKDDEYDPGGLAQVAGRILTAKGIDHEVVDSPKCCIGHSGAKTFKFAEVYGPRILSFVRHGPMPVAERSLVLNWTGYQVGAELSGKFEGDRNHILDIELPKNAGKCTLTLRLEAEPKATWALSCPNNRIAFGDFEDVGAGTLAGEGRDLQGNRVSIQLGNPVS